jgi:hypothetical protein
MGETPTPCQFVNKKTRPPPLQQQHTHHPSTNKSKPQKNKHPAHRRACTHNAQVLNIPHATDIQERNKGRGKL